MLRTRILGTLWALLPVMGLAYHFGPGQRAYQEDLASRLLDAARTQQVAAESAQDAAYARHLEAMQSRRDAAKGPDEAARAKAAGDAETAAYATAADQWQRVADTLQQAMDALSKTSTAKLDSVRWARGRALIRAGRIETGVDDLEELLESLDQQSAESRRLAQDVREDLATGYYYKARLMRMAGAKSPDWREVSAKARQNFRYLAESAIERGEASDAVKNYQNNVELVLNLEQSSLSELEAKPLPKNSPRGNREGNRPGKGKSKRPPTRKDARDGAGGAGDIGPGW